MLAQTRTPIRPRPDINTTHSDASTGYKSMTGGLNTSGGAA
jgi:hypothetical protein